MQIDLAYGKETRLLEIPDENLAGVLLPNPIAPGPTGADAVELALDSPIASPFLEDIIRPGEKIALVTSDITRPMPSHTVLPVILDRLFKIGCHARDLTVVFGLGSHRRHTEQEMRQLVGDAVFDTVACVDHDVSDVVRIGRTALGTPVDVFRPVVEADRRICLGNIEYHYFAGYSGGAKAIMPALCTYETIQQNHSRMILPAARAGAIDDNPVRQDIDDVARLIRIDFLINVVLDEHKQIVHAVAGDVIAAHRAGCLYLDTLYKCRLSRAAEIVVVSPGGHPKDINVYQAQKALDNARHAVSSGGVIIWLAACGEGLGERHFEDWMLRLAPEQRIVEIKRNFVLGGHKAAAIALTQQKARVLLISDLDPDFVRHIGLEPVADLPGALAEARRQMGNQASILVMPYGGSTLPVVE